MKNGPYILVVAPPGYPGKKYRGRYCYEHHLVWWQAGKQLPKINETAIHHKNHDKHDNRIENLELLTVQEHQREHRFVERPLLHCPECDTPFKPSRLYPKHIHFCSRQCAGAFNGRKAKGWHLKKSNPM